MRAPAAALVRRVTPLLAPAFATACGAGDRTATVSLVRDSAGVEIVETASPAWSDSERWRLAAEPTVEIGVVDGPAEYRFSSVATVIRIHDGGILVGDDGSRELRFYDAAGNHVRSVGGPGEGPGEFRALSGVAVVADSLLIYDRTTGRVSVFDADGTYHRSFRLGRTDDPIYTARRYRLEGRLGPGRLLLLPYAFDAAPKPAPTVYWDSAANLVYGTDGVLLDTLGGFSGMDMYGDPGVGTQIRLGSYTSADIQSGRLYIGHAHEYEIEVYGADGDLERIIRRVLEPTPVDETIRRERLNWLLSLADGESERRRYRREFREDVELGRFAESLPLYSQIVVDRLRNVWVQRYRPRWRRGAREWDVFDGDGRWLGTVTMPDRLTVHEIGPTYVLGVQRDELGVEYVRMYDLIKGG